MEGSFVKMKRTEGRKKEWVLKTCLKADNI